MKESSPPPAHQSLLFFAEQTQHSDGTITVRPRRLVDGNTVTAKRAAAMLGFKDRETVYGLIKTGQIRAWKPKSKKDNGKYRVDLGSVLDYKAKRERIARGAEEEM